MRLAKPDLGQKDQIHQTGLALINLFASDFFTKLDNYLKSHHHLDLLVEYRKTNLVYQNYNFKDPSNLLKEIIRASTSPLRIPIRAHIEQKDMVIFFDRLETILDDRNDWVHHNQSFNKESLKSLILDIFPVATKMDLEMTAECDYLLSLLSGVDPDVTQAKPKDLNLEDASELVREITSLVSNEEPIVGSIIDEPLIEFSYVLHLTGEIRDRKTNELLSDFHPNISEYLGALLIARKPTGGRLRVTQTGVIVAYFEDHWGYLAKIDKEMWFPGHLKYSL